MKKSEIKIFSKQFYKIIFIKLFILSILEYCTLFLFIKINFFNSTIFIKILFHIVNLAVLNSICMIIIIKLLDILYRYRKKCIGKEGFYFLVTNISIIIECIFISKKMLINHIGNKFILLAVSILVVTIYTFLICINLAVVLNSIPKKINQNSTFTIFYKYLYEIAIIFTLFLFVINNINYIGDSILDKIVIFDSKNLFIMDILRISDFLILFLYAETIASFVYKILIMNNK